MSCQIYEIWDELCSELFAIAPAYQACLARPISARAIHAIERDLELTLPSDYAQFLQIHNGTLGDFFLAFEFFGILDARGATQVLGIRHNLKNEHYELVKGKVYMLEFGAKWGAG